MDQGVGKQMANRCWLFNSLSSIATNVALPINQLIKCSGLAPTSRFIRLSHSPAITSIPCLRFLLLYSLASVAYREHPVEPFLTNRELSKSRVNEHNFVA